MSTSQSSPEISRSRDCAECPTEPVLERIASRVAEIGKKFNIRRALPNRQIGRVHV